MNTVFQDNAYLNELESTEFLLNPNWGFTMMRVFDMLYKQEKPVVKHLEEVEGEISFDRCIALPQDEEVYGYKVQNQFIKKVYYSSDGKLFNYDAKLNQFINIYATNLSWVPNYVFERIFNTALKQLNTKNTKHPIKRTMHILSLKKPIQMKIRDDFYLLRKKVGLVS